LNYTGVPLSVIMTFNRMKQLSTNVGVVVAAVKVSDAGLVEVIILCSNGKLTFLTTS